MSNILEFFLCLEDRGKVGPFGNYSKNILKNLKTVKNSGDNRDHRQIFICNNHKCILIRSRN